ncbi:ATP-grasp domain-containing protein [Actinophytocola sp.]|uniref:ATP-grasp domain-containing protein n=1 Tax=Actinophytocola sp. TaxID=1872138 RepID=UPI002D7F62B5|nr:ATP-grasp domain-containing protein [Actinophytocola sp.]HET9140733.1 ATP-grasp domain-containing protein [Actinophytocola sp.]
MTGRSRILMVMPYAHLVRKAVQAGFEVYAIWDPNLVGDNRSEVVARSAEVIWTDFKDEPGLRWCVTETAIRYGVEHVLHLGWEDTQIPVAEQAEALGLAPNPAASLRVVNDKAAMRRVLAERGLSTVRTVELGTPDGVADALAGFDLPVVVKPTRLAGSRGVRLVRDGADLAAWADMLAADGYHGPVLVEEFLRGNEFSVETLSAGGTHHVVGITAKQVTPLPLFVETGHLHPAPLTAADRRAITDLVTALLDVAGYRFGPAHTEVILTPAGPKIVESQARLGGDRIPLLVEVATGFDIEAGVFQALAGKPVEPAIASRVGCVAFFQLQPGRLESVDGLDEIEALPYVRELKFPFRQGDLVPETVSSGTRHGHVVFAAATAAEAQLRADQLRGRLRAVTSPDGASR